VNGHDLTSEVLDYGEEEIPINTNAASESELSFLSYAGE